MNILFIEYFLLLAFCLFSYYGTLDGEYVFDDRVAIMKNQDVTEPMKINLEKLFYHDFWGQDLNHNESHKSFRPLTTLMFRIEYNYLKLRSHGMKCVNLILHSINTLLLFTFLNRIVTVNQSKISLFTSILFAVHPVHTEAVSGVVGRAELLFCLCYILALIIYSSIDDDDVDDDTDDTCSLKLFNLKYFGIVILAIIGLFFKENAISILPSCICYDFIFRSRIFQEERNRKLLVNRIILWRSVLLMMITSFLILCRLYVQNFESPNFKPMDNPIAVMENHFHKFLSQSYLYILNMWILLCPEWLSYDWALGCVQLVESILDFRCLGSAILYFALYKLSFKKSKLIMFSVCILIIPFLPASGLIRVGFVIAERILYVPSIGFCLLVSIGLFMMIEKLPKLKLVLYMFFSALIFFYILRSRQRAGEWMNEDSLFSSALDVCPNNAKIHYNIARLATDKGDRKKAFQHYHRAIELYSNYESALMNLGNLYRDIGDLQTSEQYLRKSIEILEKFPTAWMNLGIVQATQKNYDEALRSYERALSYKKRYPNCLYNMGNLFLDMKNYSMAMKYWQESVALNPSQPKTWANILTLLDNRGLHEDAVRISARALTFIPKNTAIMFIRANVLGKLQNYIEAEELYLKIIKMEPQNAMYYSNLGVLYHRWDRKDLAIKNYKMAINLDPKLKNAKRNLEKLLKKH